MFKLEGRTIPFELFTALSTPGSATIYNTGRRTYQGQHSFIVTDLLGNDITAFGGVAMQFHFIRYQN